MKRNPTYLLGLLAVLVPLTYASQASAASGKVNDYQSCLDLVQKNPADAGGDVFKQGEIQSHREEDLGFLGRRAP